MNNVMNLKNSTLFEIVDEYGKSHSLRLKDRHLQVLRSIKEKKGFNCDCAALQKAIDFFWFLVQRSEQGAIPYFLDRKKQRTGDLDLSVFAKSIMETENIVFCALEVVDLCFRKLHDNETLVTPELPVKKSNVLRFADK